MKHAFWRPALRFANSIRRAAGVDAAPFKSVRPGDVVVDSFTNNRVTVERVEGDRAAVVWFEGSALHRGSLLCRNLIPD